MKTYNPLFLFLFLCLAMAINSAPALAVQDSFEPILETLQYQQKQAHLKAAPSGRDEPLAPIASDARPIVISNDVIETVASSLERVAEVRTQELTLEEKRQTQAFDQELQQFGYEVFNRGEIAQIVGNVSVPADYVVGSGDTVVVQLYGKRNVEYRLVVTREGKLLIPEFGPLDVAGLSFAQVRELIVDGFKTRVIGAKTAVTMGDIRSL